MCYLVCGKGLSARGLYTTASGRSFSDFIMNSLFIDTVELNNLSTCDKKIICDGRAAHERQEKEKFFSSLEFFEGSGK